MKKLLLLPLLALLAVTGMSAQKKAADKSAKARYEVYGVAFYNLENLFDTINNNGKYDIEFSPAGARQWDGKKYWSKINNLARAITNFTTQTTPSGPAFIGVSEIENRSVLEDLVKAVDNRLISEGKRPWGLRVVHHDSPDARGVDVGLLYNPRYFKLENVTNHRLHAVPFRTRDQMCVVGSLLGQRIAVIVNHWPSRLGGQEQSEPNRKAAAALSKAIADSLWTVDPEMGVIVMGDLNDDPQDASCAEVLGGKRKIKDAAPHGFYNPFWEMLDKGIGTLAYKSSWNLFDQIIISGNLATAPENRWHYLRAIVHNHDFLKDKEGNRVGYPRRTFSAGSYLNGYSDHFPTEVLLVRKVERK